jgi:hypothetical protein
MKMKNLLSCKKKNYYVGMLQEELRLVLFCLSLFQAGMLLRTLDV